MILSDALSQALPERATAQTWALVREGGAPGGRGRNCGKFANRSLGTDCKFLAKNGKFATFLPTLS